MAKVSKREKKRQRNILIMGLFFVGLMIFSLIAGNMSGSDIDKYNDVSIRLDQQGVSARIDGEWIPFSYHPSSLEYIETDEGVNEILSKNQLYFTFNPEDNYIQGIEFMRLGLQEYYNGVGSLMQIGVTEVNQYYNFPTIGCENATSEMPVLLVEESNETKIVVEGNCVIAYGSTDTEFVALRDRIVYGLYGVME